MIDKVEIQAKNCEQRTHFVRFSLAAPLKSAVLSFFILCSFAQTGCLNAYRKSIGDVDSHSFQKIFLTDMNTAWQACTEVLKNNQLDVSNKEAGFIQTKWIDNTAERNFVEFFGTPDSLLKAKFRFRLNLSSGFLNGKPSVRVAVQKEQLVQRDVLESLKPVETDGIEENTLIYRIGRVIHIRMKLAHQEEEKRKKEIEKAQF